MNTKSCFHVLGLFLAFLILLHPARLAAQSAGGVDFVALVSPAGGQPEPVRQLTFYLLRKSVEDIRKEALQQAPLEDLDKFIDGLDVSPELKAWMKKHHSIRLSGDDFTKSLTPDDIVDIPEYIKAYMTHNEAYRGAGFPSQNSRRRSAAPIRKNTRQKRINTMRPSANLSPARPARCGAWTSNSWT